MKQKKKQNLSKKATEDDIKKRKRKINKKAKTIKKETSATLSDIRQTAFEQKKR